MPSPPTKPRRATKTADTAKGVEAVPAENVEILKQGLGVDVTSSTPQQIQAFVVAMTRSMSVSPYSSAEMLQEYRDRGFPDLPDKVINAINQQVEHRQRLESIVTTRQERREDLAQWGAQAVAVVGLVGSLAAAYAGVSAWVCITGIVVSIGGPNAATIVGRLLDRSNH